MVANTNNINRSAIRSDLRRYRRAGFDFAGIKYEITGGVRNGFNLWQLTPATHGFQGFVREIVHQASTLDGLLDAVEN